jgi:putative inorganic carbon (hco3(-)) transporter
MAATTRTAELRTLPDPLSAGFGSLWRFLKGQPASFWFINAYLFVEYVRPQQVWTAMDVLPWGLTTLVLALVAFVLEGRLPSLRTPAGPLLMVYTLVLVLSSLFAIVPEASYQKWELYFSWVLVYLLITNIVTTEKRFFVFMMAFLLYSLKMSQHGFRSWMFNGFGFSNWGVTGSPGWFHNSGEFGIQMCVFLPLSVEFFLALRHQWGKWTRLAVAIVPLTAIGSIIASSSRGALVGAGLVAMWWIMRSEHRVRTLLIVVAVCAATWSVVPAEQKARFSTAGEDRTSTTRIDRWQAGLDMAQRYPVLGIGYNNWATVYGPLSHNIFIEAVAELGYTGLLAFVALIVATFVVNAQTRRLLRKVPTSTRFLHHMAHGLDGALIGFLGSGFFVTVLYYPFFWFNLAFTVALHAAAVDTRRRLLSPVQPHRAAARGFRRSAAPTMPLLPPAGS